MTDRRRVLATAAGIALATWGLSCVGPPVVEPEELPATPMALVWLEPEAARQLAETALDSAGLPGGFGKEGVAHLNELGDVFGGAPDPQSPEFMGEPSLYDPRTGELSPLQAIPVGGLPLEWSNDHRRLLFAAPRFGGFQLQELDRDTGQVRPLTRGSRSHPTGSLAPDGRLVYSELIKQEEGHQSRLWITNQAGGEARPLTAGPGDYGPVWAPDGSAIVFQTYDDARREAIAVLDPVEGEPRLVALGRDPTFTPDGAWIVYSQRFGKGYRLRRMRPDGTGKLGLGSAPEVVGDELHPAVSPDGRYVAYVARRVARRTLRIRRFDGGGDRPVLDNGDGLVPVW